MDRFFEILLPLYSDDAYDLKKAMFSVTLQDKEAQAAAFDLIMSLEDPAMLDESGVFLTYVKDPDLIARMVDAFTSDSNPHRRAALASALGQGITFTAAQPVVESILAGRNPALQAAALKWLTIESLSKEPELAGRLTQTLRTLVLAGETASLRSAAVTALKGDPTEAGARFLIDRILNDPSPEVQRGAIWSLPIGLTSIKPPMAAEQADTLWKVFRDESRYGDVRYHAARLILTCASWNRLSISDDERQTLDSWIDAWQKVTPR